MQIVHSPPKVPLTQDIALGKKLSLFDYFTIGFGAIIGVGWVISVGDWINIGGGPFAAILAFIMGALLLLPIARVYGSLTSDFPTAGGALVYTHMAYGEKAGFITGWFLALGYIMLCPWEVIAIGQVSETLFPALKTLPLYTLGGYTVFLPTVIVNLTISFIIIICNFRGVDIVAKIQRIMVYSLMAVGIMAVVVSAVFGRLDSGMLSTLPTPLNPGGSLGIGFISILAITPFYYAGFDTIPQEAEECSSQTDSKSIGKTLAMSILAACIFYILIILCLSAAMPWQKAITYTLPSADVYDAGLGMPVVAKIIIVGALCGIISTFNSFFMAGARVLFALGRNKMVSPVLGKVHSKYQTPFVANAVIAVITLLGSFLGKSFLLPICNVCSFGFMLAWLMVSFSALRIRRREHGTHLTLRQQMLHYAAIASGILMLLILILPYSPGALKWPLEWCIVFIWLLIGVFLLMTNGKQQRRFG